MEGKMCRICEHQAHHHRESGCQLTTCSCIKFEENNPINPEEQIESQKNSATQNIREKSDKWVLNPQAFKKSLSVITKQESPQDRQTSQSEIWDEVEANWKKVDELNDDGEYENVDKELDIILAKKFENISAWIKKGHNNINLTKYDEAIICYKSALILDNKENKEINKKNYEILNFIAISHRKKNNHKEAIDFCKESLKINENFIAALYELAYNYRQIDENELAIKHCTKLLSIERTHVDALDELAYNYEQLEKWDKAIEYYNKSQDVEGKDVNDIYSDIHLAHCYLQKGDLEHAEILINKQKIVENEEQYSLQVRGQIYKNMKKYEEAIKNFEKEALYASSSRTFRWFELGYCYGEIGDVVVSLEHYKKYVELEYLSSSAAQNIGWGLSFLGKEEEAIKNYEKGLEKNPGHFGILDNKSISHENLGQYGDAIKCLDRILEDTPERVDVLYRKCKLLVQADKITEGIEGFELIQSKTREDNHPPVEDILNNMGWSWIQKGENEKGLEYVEKALKINLRHRDALESKAVALHNLKRYAESKQCYEKIFELWGDDEYRHQIGICLKNMGDQEEPKSEKRQKYYDDAIKIFNLILEKNTRHSDSWYYKGMINWNLGKYDDAKKCQLAAIKINPDDGYYWQELAEIMNQQEMTDQAIVYFNKSIEIKQSSYVYLQIGKIMYKKKEYKKSINYFDQALEIKRTPTILIEKGNALFMILKYENETNSWDDVTDCYDEALKIDPSNSDALGNKGNAFREMKKYDDAIINLNAAIDADPEWYWPHKIKFHTYKDMKNYPDAIKISNTILEKFPDKEIDILNLLRGLYKEMGNAVKVKECKEKLQKLKDLK